MAGQTKIIIITSDEAIVRKLSLDKTKNTRIIHLDDDDDDQQTSTEIDNHQIINMALLATQPVCILF
jgi:phage repressor protein C with HTH and peptisase S24 domain